MLFFQSCSESYLGGHFFTCQKYFASAIFAQGTPLLYGACSFKIRLHAYIHNIYCKCNIDLTATPTHTIFLDTPMSSAQVILNSLNGLFQMSESATHHMLTVMEDIMIPESWESIDLIKQTEGLMCTTASLSLTEELLFVHKAQAIVDFCIECRNLWKAFKLDFTPSEGNYCYFKPLKSGMLYN